MQGRIISLQDPEYENWTMLRRTYEEKRDKSVAFAYGLRPAQPRTTTFFSYMFLHGGLGHLVGNMIFLWILGCMLEMGSGRVLFVAIYLLSGLASAGLFVLIYPTSTIPLVGASGAIAGLMGAYTVLYGTKKVSIFYSLGFFFNTATVPAIILLPVWLANECYQLFFSGASHVAYVAHIGGLAGGEDKALFWRVVDQCCRALPDDQEIVVYKNNSDRKGNSYGCHENYLTRRDDDVAGIGRAVGHLDLPAPVFERAAGDLLPELHARLDAVAARLLAHPLEGVLGPHHDHFAGINFGGNID